MRVIACWWSTRPGNARLHAFCMATPLQRLLRSVSLLGAGRIAHASTAPPLLWWTLLLTAALTLLLWLQLDRLLQAKLDQVVQVALDVTLTFQLVVAQPARVAAVVVLLRRRRRRRGQWWGRRRWCAAAVAILAYASCDLALSIKVIKLGRVERCGLCPVAFSIAIQMEARLLGGGGGFAATPG